MIFPRVEPYSSNFCLIIICAVFVPLINEGFEPSHRTGFSCSPVTVDCNGCGGGGVLLLQEGWGSLGTLLQTVLDHGYQFIHELGEGSRRDAYRLRRFLD